MYRASSTARRRMVAWPRVSTVSDVLGGTTSSEISLFPDNQQP